MTQPMAGGAEPLKRHRASRIGIVVSNKMDKSAVVAVERRFPHPIYKKFVRRTSKFMIHDEKNEAQVGDRVRIVETRPLSRRKCWRLAEILERGAVQGPATEVEETKA